MTGLTTYERDASIVARAGDSELLPPTVEKILALVNEHLIGPVGPAFVAGRWVHARWKPSESVTTAYELTQDDGPPTTVVFKCYRGDKARSLAQRSVRPQDLPTDPAGLRPMVVLEHRNAYLARFPFDRVLVGLPRAFDLRRTARLVHELGFARPQRLRPGPSKVQLLRYKPERRAVLHLAGRLREHADAPREKRSFALRVLPPDEAQNVLANRRAFDSVAAPHLGPRCLGGEARTGLVFEEWVSATSLRNDDFGPAAEAGALLAALHSTPGAETALPALAGSVDSGPFAHDATLARAAAKLPLAVPMERTTWTHGDFHPDQVATQGSATMLFDWDGLGAGDPAHDLSSWIADHLAARPDVSAREAAGPLLSGYHAQGGEPPSSTHLRTWLARALVARAAATLRRLEVDAHARARRLLDRAQTLVEREEPLE